jgi:hypothetical protein
MSVLDVGCGPGYVSAAAAEREAIAIEMGKGNGGSANCILPAALLISLA